MSLLKVSTGKMATARFLVTILSVPLIFCSCDRHKELINEKEKAEVQKKQVEEELRALDEKFHALDTEWATAVNDINRRTADVEKTNSEIEAELRRITAKCTIGEQVLKDLRMRLDSCKVKYSN